MTRSLSVAIQMDPIESINIDADCDAPEAPIAPAAPEALEPPAAPSRDAADTVST